MKLCLRCNQYFNDTVEICPKDQAALEPVGKDPLIGALIDDRYVIDSVIGKGSSGIVYKASRLMMGGEIAVKVIHSYLGADSASLDRLLRELKAAERLRHAHIITVWDSGTTDDGQPYLVMDYLEGITLSQLITQKGALPPKRVLNVIRQVADALAHAHEQGLIHRDMKPENIVLEESEIRGDYAKVLDFGIADTPQESAQRAKFNKPKTVAGSPAYMSPEQCQGFELDYRSDLYSLAVIVFEMFTGRRPFLAHDLMKLMYMTVTEAPPKMGQVRKDLSFPESVEAVLAKALSKLPDERQSTIREFWKELEQACANLEFGKADRAKTVQREQQNVSDMEILPSERLMDDDKPKRPQFEMGPEDMPELFMPPPPPPKEGGTPRPPQEAGAPPRQGGMANLINKQQIKPAGEGTGALPSNSNTNLPAAGGPTAAPSSSGTVKPLQPARVGPGGAKLPPGGPAKPPGAGVSGQQRPAGAPPLPGAAKLAGGPPPPPAPTAKPPMPGAGAPQGSGPPPTPRPTGAPPPPGAKGAPAPQKAPPPMPGAGGTTGPSTTEGGSTGGTGQTGTTDNTGTSGPTPGGGSPSASAANGPDPTYGEAPTAMPDKTMNRLSALVKRPTTSMPMPNTAPEPAKPAPAAETAQVRPPSVYSYVPPSEKKEQPEPEKSQSNQNPAGPTGQKPPMGAKAGGPGGPKPGGPGGPKPGGPGGPKQLGPGGQKPGGPQGAKPGAGPQGSKPGVPGQKTVGPQGSKPGVGPGGAKVGPGGAKPGLKPEPGKGSPTTPGKPAAGAVRPDPNKPGGAAPLAAKKPEPASAPPDLNDHGDEITPALARAGATWVDQHDNNNLDGNIGGELPQQRKVSNLDWGDEIEALKTGNVEPIVIDPPHGGLGQEALRPQQPGAQQWPPGMVPPGGPVGGPAPGMPGYPSLQQSWPPGMMPPAPNQPMMPPPGYDQSMSYPPGMMHPYMQPPGYPPAGYPLPPNQDVSGAYPMMPQGGYPPVPPNDASGSFPMMPGYQMPPAQYPYGQGMPMMMPGMPGMPPQGMPPQGMPPQGMPPQGMPPGMMPPQGMPPGMAPQGMPPQGMPPFMQPGTSDSGMGSALLDDLKSEFGEGPSDGGGLGDLFEDVPAEPALEFKKEPEKNALLSDEFKFESPKSPLSDDFDDEEEEKRKARDLAAKSAAEAEELGDSLLALIDATDNQRGPEPIETKPPEKAEKKEEPKKGGGTKALGSLLGALSASDDELEEESEPEPAGGGNAFAAAVASSASVPSLTEKVTKDTGGSAFGQLLAAVKEDKEAQPEEQEEEDSSPGASLPKQAISDALDDLLGPDDSSVSVNKIPAMKNPFEADDDLLGSAGSGASAEPTKEKEGDGLTSAAARLAAAMSEAREDDDEEDDSPMANPFNTGARSQLPNPATSTSDALSRLLEAASKAPSKASDTGSSMSEIDKMAARVNKPQAKVSRKLASLKSAEAEAEAAGFAPAEPQPFGGFGGGGGAGGFGGGGFGGGDQGGFGGGMRASGVAGTTGTNSSYSQDAVNARIAELNRKLEQQSLGRDVELPPAAPPDPSVLGDMNRRDVVNRIMEEAALRHQYGADYQPPDPAPMMKPSQSGQDFSPSDLEKVNSNRLASMAEQENRRKKTSRSRSNMPRFPVMPVVAAVVIIGGCAAGYFFFQEPLKQALNNVMANFGSTPEKTSNKDAEMLAKVNDLMSKGKLSDARKILEQEESAQGLPPELSDKLDTVYLSIAKYKKNNGATNEAIETLKLIPPESSHYGDAQKLLKSYQKGSKKSSPKRRKRG